MQRRSHLAQKMFKNIRKNAFTMAFAMAVEPCSELMEACFSQSLLQFPISLFRAHHAHANIVYEDMQCGSTNVKAIQVQGHNPASLKL